MRLSGAYMACGTIHSERQNGDAHGTGTVKKRMYQLF